MALEIHREPEADRRVRLGYAPEEIVMAEDTPGIVVTGDEQFDGKQGFISADKAAKAGIRVTGVTTEDASEHEGEVADVKVHDRALSAKEIEAERNASSVSAPKKKAAKKKAK